MIYVKDDFLPKNLVEAILKDKQEYTEYKTPGKSFWIKEPSEMFVNYMVEQISEIEGCKIQSIVCFFRQANSLVDTEWRIHNDSIIQGQKPDRALVLFLNENNQTGLNGTAFWSHKKYGDVYPGGSVDDFNELLIQDSNDLSKWNLKTVIGHKSNRLVSYPCNYFHSKYPNKFKNNREVVVMFYKKSNE